MTRVDLYRLLGVARGASMDEIRGAYRALAKQHHPDANPAPGSAAAFAAIAEAYEVLSDRVKRRDYDATLNGAGQPARSEREGVGFAQGHYAWVNVAGVRTEAEREVSEFDELYQTFFRPQGREETRGAERPGKRRARRGSGPKSGRGA